jgi:hypothetical protein
LEGDILSRGGDGLSIYHWELNGKNRKITLNEGFGGGGKTERKNLKFANEI